MTERHLLTRRQPDPGRALLATIEELERTRPTAWSPRTVHDLVAHLAAGSGGIARPWPPQS